jgi:hypothetical protein
VIGFCSGALLTVASKSTNNIRKPFTIRAEAAAHTKRRIPRRGYFTGDAGIPRTVYPPRPFTVLEAFFAQAVTIRRTPNPWPIRSMGVFSDRRLLGYPAFQYSEQLMTPRRTAAICMRTVGNDKGARIALPTVRGRSIS